MKANVYYGYICSNTDKVNIVTINEVETIKNSKIVLGPFIAPNKESAEVVFQVIYSLFAEEYSKTL